MQLALCPPAGLGPSPFSLHSPLTPGAGACSPPRSAMEAVLIPDAKEPGGKAATLPVWEGPSDSPWSPGLPSRGVRGSQCCLQGPESGPHLARAAHSCPAQAPRGGSGQTKAAVAVRGRPPQLWEGGGKGRAGCLQQQSLPAACSSQESHGQGLPTVRRGWRPQLIKNFQNSTVRKQPNSLQMDKKSEQRLQGSMSGNA